jgi:hypothetical protein
MKWWLCWPDPFAGQRLYRRRHSMPPFEMAVALGNRHFKRQEWYSFEKKSFEHLFFEKS